MNTERIFWDETAHEAKVEAFYQAGIGHDLDWHGGYRNFGWWVDGEQDYVRAADRLVRKMGERLGLDSDSHLLDCACGGAPQDMLLHREFGCEIDAVDVTWAQVVQGQRRAREAGVSDSVRVRHGSATDLPFSGAQFTHVLSIEGAQHFDTREDFFAGVRPLCRPGAVMVLCDFIVDTPAASRWERFCVRRAQRRWNVPDANVLDEAGYRASLERSGWGEITFEGVGAHIIPGYYRDQNTPETIAAHRHFKGRLWRANMFWTNYFMNKAWEKGLMEYTVVRAVAV